MVVLYSVAASWDAACNSAQSFASGVGGLLFRTVALEVGHSTAQQICAYCFPGPTPGQLASLSSNEAVTAALAGLDEGGVGKVSMSNATQICL